MQILSQSYWTPKSGNSSADYEDACSVRHGAVAVADGATESSFARRWAKALVNGFVNSPTLPMPPAPAQLQEWLRPLQTSWQAEIQWDRLPWYAEDKAREGAFSTLLGFRFLSDFEVESELKVEFEGVKFEKDSHDSALPERPWQAFAIGDSCLFQIRDDRLLKAFPLERSEQFDSRPLLLSSNPANNERVWEMIAADQGSFGAGDSLLFITDALARWFLVCCEAGEKPWRTLFALSSQAEFDALMSRLRQEHALRNDDVTLLMLQDDSWEDSVDLPAGSDSVPAAAASPGPGSALSASGREGAV